MTLLIAKWTAHNSHLEEISDLLAQEKIDWKKFQDIIRYHELAPFAYLCLKRYLHLLPDDITEILNNSYYSSLVRQSYLWREFLKIAHAFKDKDIDFRPLKGIAFLVDNIYGEKAFLRPMVDIDILIKKEQLGLVEKVLQSLGYEKHCLGMKEDYWKDKNYHLAFQRKGINGISSLSEIHWDLDYKRDRPMLPSLWERVKKFQVDGVQLSLLSPEDTLFSLALHQRRFGRMLCLKNVCDVVMLLNRYKDEFDWDYVVREARTGRMRTTLYFILTQAGLLLDIRMPDSVLASLAIPKYKRRLIQRYILRNVFLGNILSDSHASDIYDSYLKSHFLIYDNFWEPIKSILTIPPEQFAKFYRLKPYTRKARFFYKIRYLYILKKALQKIR